jgi:hypothetical protein
VGTSFGVHATLTVVMVLAVLILGLEETGLYHPDPPNPQYGWPVLAFDAGLMFVFAGLAFRAWRRAHSREPRAPERSAEHARVPLRRGRAGELR